MIFILLVWVFSTYDTFCTGLEGQIDKKCPEYTTIASLHQTTIGKNEKKENGDENRQVSLVF